MRLLGTDGDTSVFPDVVFEDGMTAIAIVGTSTGFVFAADGRLAPVEFNAPEELLALGNDHQQKIFEIADPQKSLAYAITGCVIDPDGGFDLDAVVRSQINRMSHRRFDDCRQYLRALGGTINEGINSAKQDGAIVKFPCINHVEQGPAWKFARILVAGYFGGLRCFSQVQFFHYDGKRSEFAVDQYLNLIFLSGSSAVKREMYQSSDLPVVGSIFPEYTKLLGDNPTLDDAEQYAVGYVKACCSPLALELDPKCKAMGGHIHVAEITPAGLKWRIPPAIRN